MGLDSLWHWAILLIVVVVIFGTGKVAKIGPDLGHAIRGFKNAMQGHDDLPRRETAANSQLNSNPGGTEVTQASESSTHENTRT